MYAGRQAPIQDIITTPRHPYTRLLIDSPAAEWTSLLCAR
jgi:ABC-type dipeptide/oligopeptide/nickel transport system ATPase component